MFSGPTRAQQNHTALPFVLPFLAVYAALFLYPTLQMLWMSLTNGQLILRGEFVGLDNYLKLFRDWRFGHALMNTGWFVFFTVIPGTLLGLMLALLVARLSGLARAAILAIFFLPYILPVTTVMLVWQWLIWGLTDLAAPLTDGKPIRVYGRPVFVLPLAATITVWWTTGFNILLFLAGLRAIPTEIYEAARLDGANRRALFWRITWPLIWPVTALVATLQLLMQIKVFDQIYLLVLDGRVDATLVLVQYIYALAFQRNAGGYAAAVAVAFFVIVVTLSVLQFQFRRLRGAR